MYFDDVKQIQEIAGRNGCSVFVVPDGAVVEIKGAIVLQPDEKTVISIEQVQDVIKLLSTRQVSEMYVVVRPADKLSDAAANAFLKNLEEPGENVHFILVTDSLSKILPTILSRSAVYILRQEPLLAREFCATDKVKTLAKRLLVAKGAELVTLAEEITKKKDGVRSFAMEVLGAAIEMSYRSYYITKKEVFIQKIPKFLDAYEAISQNGHAKLHLVADLI